MPSWPEARTALRGLKLLLRFDAGFALWFDRSPAGARRSFRLMIPMLPVFLLSLFQWADASSDASPLLIGATIAVYYVLGWVMFPLILIVIGRAIERENQAIGTLSPYIWLNSAISLLSCLLTLLGEIQVIGAFEQVLGLLLVIASLVYETYLLRTLMGIGYLGAALSQSWTTLWRAACSCC